MKKPLDEQILDAIQAPKYQPIKPKALARKLAIASADYADFKQTLKQLARKGQIEIGDKNAIGPPTRRGQIIGVFRSIRGGGGYVRPRSGQGQPTPDIYIKAKHSHDAATGDVVLVAIAKTPKSPAIAPDGVVVEVIERATEHFVGTYVTRDGEGFVRVNGALFHEDIYVGDPGAKGAQDGDKVVFEMLRFPSAQMTGEGVITEVLGARGQPGVDLLSVIRQFNLPDAFSEVALEEAREQARLFAEQTIGDDRLDLTGQTMVTVDPVDARDFDDAVSLDRDDKGHWRLGVHIADVSTFVRVGSALDKEAKRRGTSVYLPGKVIPMLPELISNGLASLQQGHVRYTKTVFIDFDPEGRITHVEFANSAIKVAQRLTYETVLELFNDPSRHQAINPEVMPLLERMRELASLLRRRRRTHGFLELSMPEVQLEYDSDGKIVGAEYSHDDESHQMIEEFMLTANEAVAQKLKDEKINFLRRVHELPDPLKLKAFGEFVRSLGLKLDDYRSRFELQRVVREVADKPLRHSVHYALLRSLKQAGYGPEDEGHYAVASECYCHFTSPIRRYPDLTVHRVLDQWIRRRKAGQDFSELVVLGEHCSFTERRAAKAERELIKVKLLEYLSTRVGQEMEMLITGVEEYGFYAQGIDFPAEGLVHVRTLTDDFYQYDRALHTLAGKRAGKCYRLGDQIRLVIWKVDQEHRQLDLRLADDAAPRRSKTIRPKVSKPKRPTRQGRRKR